MLTQYHSKIERFTTDVRMQDHTCLLVPNLLTVSQSGWFLTGKLLFLVDLLVTKISEEDSRLDK